jgi:hypothetical protein
MNGIPPVESEEPPARSARKYWGRGGTETSNPVAARRRAEQRLMPTVILYGRWCESMGLSVKIRDETISLNPRAPNQFRRHRPTETPRTLRRQ